MSRRLLTLLPILFSVSSFAQTSTSSIQGQVVDAKTGSPVRFADVVLYGPYAQSRLIPPRQQPNTRPPTKEMTADDQGRFSFRDLAPGNYAVGSRRDGYAPTRLGATGTARDLLPVKEAEQVTGVTIKMPPCGVIAGKVTNEKGEPVGNVELVVLRYYYGVWMWRLSATPETPLKTYTNDLGEFRISNLIAGQYIVRAAAPRLGTPRRPVPPYPSTFYRNGLSPENAEPINVTSGGVSTANISLQPGPAYFVSGTIDAAGSDQEVCFGLAPKRYYAGLAQTIGMVRYKRTDGTFMIDDVPPGSYVLSAAICRGNTPLGAIQPIEVAGDVRDLRISLNPGVQLSGVVKMEGVNAAGVRLLLHSPELIPGFRPVAQVKADGTFVFDHVLPRHHIVEVAQLPPGAYVKSVKYAGREVPEAGFEFESGATLEIAISNQNAAQLTGTILDKTGKPAAFAMVTVIPSDGGPALSARDIMADEKGVFTFPALRPGTYKALAWQVRFNPFGLEAADPMLPKLFEANARAITISPGAPQTVSLTLNTLDDVDTARALSNLTPPKNQ